MVDFSGWDMPVNYRSQIEEHHAVRRDAGMFDVSHMLAIDLHGAATRAFLLLVLANNVSKLQTAGRALYSCMLNEAGGVIDDLIAYFFADVKQGRDYLLSANDSQRKRREAIREHFAIAEAEGFGNLEPDVSQTLDKAMDGLRCVFA